MNSTFVPKIIQFAIKIKERETFEQIDKESGEFHSKWMDLLFFSSVVARSDPEGGERGHRE